MAYNERSIQDMVELLGGDVDEGTTKTAAAAPSTEAVSTEILNKIRQDFTEDEIVKAATSAQYSGKIMADVIFQKMASEFAPFIAEVVAATCQNVIPQLIKQAIGTSNVIPDGHTQGEQKFDSKPFREEAAAENSVGTDISSVTEKWLHVDKVEGAVVEGSHGPDSPGGKTPSGMMSPQKLASLKRKLTEANVKLAEMKVAGVEDDVQRYEMLQQKAASGQITPQEQQEMQMLEQKLSAVMGQQGGQGGPPQGGGDPQQQAGPPQDAAKAASAILAQYGLEI